jgi:fructose/tagatose bisphosphate aldolase
MNIDTDLQFAFTEGIRDYIEKYWDLKTQIGNPEGADVPNKNITIQENGCVKVKSLSIQDGASICRFK